mmetsp:Transcript_13176/g.20090  ORF Transcript_13176/g.20090 Transcript_13176/m.20090 type:complete len:247 (+) Transcript_13176:129-869(+)
MASSKIQDLSDDTRRKANLRVLQRLDDKIEDIVESASHVGLYEFSQIEQKWDKKPTEGSLFLVKRSCEASSRFQLIILNRSSAENWTLDVTSRMQLQNTDPYLILRHKEEGQSAILGIWFHNGDERDNMAALLTKAIQSLESVPPRVESTIDPGVAATTLLSPLTLGDHTIPVKHAPTPQNATSRAVSQTNDDSPNQNHLVLDKKSLQLSLLSLIQDERFLDLIHAQYLKVAHARANRKPSNGDSA